MPPSPASLADRIALVTGASRGIGAATALALSKAGAHVVAVARTVGGLEELDDAIRKAGGSATLVPLDVTDFEGLARLAVALNERYGRLDILIGNAGIAGPCSPLDHLTLKDWDEVMKVNVTANWQLICAMDALLRRSGAGRAVFLTSGAAHHMRPYWGLYATSKVALEDRKSTRLNSSHSQISYAVFCLKKKNTKPTSQIAKEKTDIQHVQSKTRK